MERVVYDRESGQLLTGSFMDYAMPRAADMPHIEIENNSVPTNTNPMGAKGAGEAGTVGSLSAGVNAIVDALCDPLYRVEDSGSTPGWEPVVIVNGLAFVAGQPPVEGEKKPHPEIAAHNAGSTPLNTTAARMTASKIPVIIPNRDFASVYETAFA